MALGIYKRGQGYYTRLYTALVLFVIVATGSYVLYSKLQGSNIWVATLVPMVVCVLFGVVIYFLVNRASVADFMIAAEGEIKKVSWSSKKEIIASTLVVICVVALMALMLWVADMVFQLIFRYVIRIY